MISRGPTKDDGARQTLAERFYSLVALVLLLISRFSKLAIVIAIKPTQRQKNHIADHQLS
jgi:hypothetical protein